MQGGGTYMARACVRHLFTWPIRFACRIANIASWRMRSAVAESMKGLTS